MRVRCHCHRVWRDGQGGWGRQHRIVVVVAAKWWWLPPCPPCVVGEDEGEGKGEGASSPSLLCEGEDEAMGDHGDSDSTCMLFVFAWQGTIGVSRSLLVTYLPCCEPRLTKSGYNIA